MKKARLTAWILAAVLCAGTALSGCGNAEETADEEVFEIEHIEEEEPEEAEPEEEEVVEIQEIGDPTASIEIMLTNEMGDVITGLSIKSPLEKEYPDNMMTSDQKIEDKETVKLFYEPVTEEDIEPSDDEAILPDESYVGYWDESDDVDADGWELTIFDASDESVTFHLFGYRAASSDDYVVATFDDQNVGHFSTYLNGDKETSGTITFYKDSVVVVFEQSDFQMTIPCTFVFDETHDVSREEGNNSPMENWEARKASEDDSGLVSEETEEDSEQMHELEQIPVDEDTYTLQVTMKNGDIYELIGFDVEDMEEVTLYLEDGVAYIEYMSLSQNVLISTKEKEIQIKADKEAAQVVIDMIDAIGTVTEDNAEEHRAAIEAARAAYDALTDAQKAYVTNYQLLVEMERTLNSTNNGESNESSQKQEYSGEGANLEGYELGRAGYPEDDPRVVEAANKWKEIMEDFDYPEALDDFWNAYYAGYAEFVDYEENTYDMKAYRLGYNTGSQGYSFADAEAMLKENLGITSSSPYYQNFLNGYNDGHEIYEQNYEYVDDSYSESAHHGGEDESYWEPGDDGDDGEIYDSGDEGYDGEGWEGEESEEYY